jgi:hypothetical protein
MRAEIKLQSDANQNQLDLIFEMMREVREVPGDVVEIGSWKCGTSGAIAATWPLRTVWAFDLFGGLPYGMEGPPWDYFANTKWEEIQETAANFPNLKLVRGLHEETVPEFAKKQQPIALLFMDSDHYSTHKVSLEHLGPLVSREGVILFHDWCFQEVQQAISETINADDWKMMDGRDMHGMGALRKN